MNCVLFAKMEFLGKKNKTLKKILEKWGKNWKSQGILLVPEKWEPCIVINYDEYTAS